MKMQVTFDVLKLNNFFTEDYILVGNLPYYSSNKIIRNFISSSFKPSEFSCNDSKRGSR
jgi:16S rRNA A1518/A1519 N6-dimethyltransferase RsmA/KsgA/DIM1 with predicted DNA glycosylase/AP lyase activity